MLFGRGGINDYPGNKHYRALVQAQKSAYFSAKSSKEKRAIAKSIIQQLDNLHPPGRFIIEDRSGLCHMSSTANNDATDYSHPLVRNKVWVQVSDDLAIDKIMHSLREKVKEKDKKISSSLSSKAGNKSNKNKEKKNVARSDSLTDDKDANLEPIGENESVGQFDDLFDDIVENSGQCDGLLVDNATDNEVGQFDDLFDDTGLQEFTGEDMAGQFDGLFDDDS